METKYLLNQNMSENGCYNKVRRFIEQHDREIIAITTATVVSIGVVAFFAISNSAIPNSAAPLISKSVEKSVTSSLSKGIITNVKEHIRNLPEGWHPSVKKVESAAKFGYSLERHQTWVNAYTRAKF